MKHALTFVFVLGFSCCLYAQAVDTTVCEILDHPQSFNGKMVRIKGTVAAGFDQFVVKGADCGINVNKNIWLSYPEGIKAKAGPAVMVQVQPAHNFAGDVPAVQRTPVTLDKNNKDFKLFDSQLSTPYKKGGMCLGCNKFEVTATLVGRLDAVEKAGVQRDKAGKIVGFGGFGHMNAYVARLVLQSVSDVTSQEIDYSKTAAISKGEIVSETGVEDPVADAHKTAKAYPPSSPLGARLERAAAAFGKPGDHNGVVVGFGVLNEATNKGDAKGETDSPDGVLFNCKLDMARLKGSALSIAIAYAGTLIADIRSPEPAGGITGTYALEQHGWQTAVLGAIGNRLKTLTVPGSYLLWNTAWAPADRDKSLEDALKDFLANEELLAR